MTGDNKRTVLPSGHLDCSVDHASLPDSDTENLRVLFVVDSFLPGAGGAEIQALNLGRALVDRGVYIEFVAPRLHRNWAKEHTLDGMKVTKIDYPKIRLFGSAILIMKFGWFLLRHRHDFDSIHIHITSKLASMAGLLRPLLKTRIIAKISGYYEFEEGVLNEVKNAGLVTRFNKAGLHNIDYFQTISEQTREKLLESGFKDGQIRYIPNGIKVATTDRTKVLAADKEFIVGFCGRLRDIKGVDVLIKAIALAVHKEGLGQISLRIAGEGRTQATLEALVRESGIESRVSFLGLIEETDLFLAGLDLYVQPSYAEGLPNSVIEAMNAGCPIVGTDIGGTRELVQVGINGYLVPAGDHDAMALRIKQCIELGPGLARFGEQSRSIVAKSFGFDKVTDKLIELYSS